MKIAVIGVGLIGGSLALSMKGKHGVAVTGFCHDGQTAERVRRRQVTDHVTTSLQEAVEDADVIFLSVPVGLLSFYMEQVLGCNPKPGCIITDVGSTKASIVEAAEKLNMTGVHFIGGHPIIGGHPMAGSERSGVEAATSYLFENAYYVLTPLPGTPETAIERLSEIIGWTKAKVIQVEAARHDDIVGAISHLPHVIAVALVNQIRKYHEADDLYKVLAAGGFRDITRIASSDPQVWRDILLNNREIVLKLLNDWDYELSHFRQLLLECDGEGIQNEFKSAGEFRSSVPERRKGMISSFKPAV
ncbi:prephenate dehydrogenase [Paenibacillus larvae]